MLMLNIVTVRGSGHRLVTKDSLGTWVIYVVSVGDLVSSPIPTKRNVLTVTKSFLHPMGFHGSLERNSYFH